MVNGRVSLALSRPPAAQRQVACGAAQARRAAEARLARRRGKRAAAVTANGTAKGAAAPPEREEDAAEVARYDRERAHILEVPRLIAPSRLHSCSCRASAHPTPKCGLPACS